MKRDVSTCLAWHVNLNDASQLGGGAGRRVLILLLPLHPVSLEPGQLSAGAGLMERKGKIQPKEPYQTHAPHKMALFAPFQNLLETKAPCPEQA